jgi:hypothetical protein
MLEILIIGVVTYFSVTGAAGVLAGSYETGAGFGASVLVFF